MGKKGRRKTRWRRLSIGDGSANEEESEGPTPPPQVQKPRLRPKRIPQPLVVTEKKTFNEEEYTKITTPRQDVLFKKGYLAKKRPVATSNADTAKHADAANGECRPPLENGDPVENSISPPANHEVVTPEEETPIYCTNGYADPGTIYYVNGNYDYYDPYAGVYSGGMMIPGPYAPPAPVLAAVPCQPLPLQPLEWFNPRPPPEVHWCYVTRKEKKKRGSDSQNCSPQGTQSSESTGTPGSPREDMEGPHLQMFPMGPPAMGQPPAPPPPTYVYPGYMFGPTMYNMNGVVVSSPPQQQPPSEVKRRKKKRKRRGRRGYRGEGGLTDDGSELSSSEAGELEEKEACAMSLSQSEYSQVSPPADDGATESDLSLRSAPDDQRQHIEPPAVGGVQPGEPEVTYKSDIHVQLAPATSGDKGEEQAYQDTTLQPSQYLKQEQNISIEPAAPIEYVQKLASYFDNKVPVGDVETDRDVCSSNQSISNRGDVTSEATAPEGSDEEVTTLTSTQEPPVPPPRRKFKRKKSIDRPPTPGELSGTDGASSQDSGSSNGTVSVDDDSLELLPEMETSQEVNVLEEDDDVIFTGKGKQALTRTVILEEEEEEEDGRKSEDQSVEAELPNAPESGPDASVGPSECSSSNQQASLTTVKEPTAVEKEPTVIKPSVAKPVEQMIAEEVNVVEEKQVTLTSSPDPSTLEESVTVSAEDERKEWEIRKVAEPLAHHLSEEILKEAVQKATTLPSRPITTAVTTWLKSQPLEEALPLPPQEGSDSGNSSEGEEEEEDKEDTTGPKNVQRNPLPAPSSSLLDVEERLVVVDCDGPEKRVGSVSESLWCEDLPEGSVGGEWDEMGTFVSVDMVMAESPLEKPAMYDPLKFSKYYQLGVSTEEAESASGAQVHEIDTDVSECGSEDVELIPRRYGPPHKVAEEENGLSLSVELMHLKDSQQTNWNLEQKSSEKKQRTNVEVYRSVYGERRCDAANDSGVQSEDSGDEVIFAKPPVRFARSSTVRKATLSDISPAIIRQLKGDGPFPCGICCIIQ